MKKKQLIEIVLFGIAGGIGFLIDALVLHFLSRYIGPYVARIFSFFSAVIFTWLFNRAVTFESYASGCSAVGEFLRYLSLMALGGGVNIVAYMLCVHSITFVAEFPIVGVAVGSVLGMFFNFFSTKILLFKVGSVKGDL